MLRSHQKRREYFENEENRAKRRIRLVRQSVAKNSPDAELRKASRRGGGSHSDEVTELCEPAGDAMNLNTRALDVCGISTTSIKQK